MDSWNIRKGPYDTAALDGPALAEREPAEAAWGPASDDLAAQVEDLRRLHALSARLAGLLDVDAVLHEVLEGTLPALGTAHGMLWLAPHGGGELVLAGHRGLDPEFLAEIQRVPPGSGIWDIALARRCPVTITAVEVNPHPSADLAAMRRAGFRAGYATPLVTRRDEGIGVLLALFHQPDGPGPRQTRLADLHAHVSANCLGAARLHRGLQQELDDQNRALAREHLARAEGEQALRVKDALLAGVCHELRTPINTVMGWAHILGTPSADAATMRRGLEAIARNAEAETQLLEDILDASRAMAGQLRLDATDVDLARVIEAAVGAMRAEAGARGVRLTMKLDPAGAHVAGEPRRLQQAVRHLVLNAVKVTPSGGQVEVRLERARDRARIAVRDAGPGIAPDLVAEAFAPFRDPGSTTRARHGLGLWVARHLIELHGGMVRAESDGDGCGALITAQLPLAEISSPAPPQSAPACLERAAGAPALRRPLAALEILVVDDDLDALGMLGAMLRDAGATVHSATSAAEALRLAREHTLDVLISDLAMPGEDGYSLIRSLRTGDLQRGRQTPAIALTAYVKTGDRASAMAAGFNLFVNKPVDPEELIAAIARLAEPRVETAAGRKRSRATR